MSSNFLSLGGLAQIFTPPGGSKTGFAIECLEKKESDDHYIFIADEGVLYPAAVAHYWKIPLSRLLIVKTNKAEEVWKVGLEAIQTGLFGWSLLRPSQSCHPHHLRKLQLSAERTQSRVLILSNLKLPHWMLRAQLHAESHNGNVETHPLPSRDISLNPIGGGLPRAYAQGFAP